MVKYPAKCPTEPSKPCKANKTLYYKIVTPCFDSLVIRLRSKESQDLRTRITWLACFYKTCKEKEIREEAYENRGRISTEIAAKYATLCTTLSDRKILLVQ